MTTSEAKTRTDDLMLATAADPRGVLAVLLGSLQAAANTTGLANLPPSIADSCRRNASRAAWALAQIEAAVATLADHAERCKAATTKEG